MTFLAALRRDRDDASLVADGPIHRAMLQPYVERVLIPALQPGDVVVPARLIML